MSRLGTDTADMGGANARQSLALQTSPDMSKRPWGEAVAE